MENKLFFSDHFRTPSTGLDYDTLDLMKRSHSTWRLLNADTAPLIISFLNDTFVEPNAHTIPETILAEKLDDCLYFLREAYGKEAFRRNALDYLKEWTEPDKNWLRRFYPQDSDEAAYNLTSSAANAISWAKSLTRSSFVGTESRLKTVFDLLRQMVEGTEIDPALRIDELRKRRDEIDEEIKKAEAGEIFLLDDTALKERFHLFSDTAWDLLRDFREVEENFRELDRSVREKITLWKEGKGALLDKVLGEQDAIAQSDQGRSFYAFADFLMSHRRQEELGALLDRVMAMEAVQSLRPEERLRRIHYLWLDASEHTMRTAARLSSQLRDFLDNKVWLENRRIVDILNKITEHAFAIRNDQPQQSDFMPLSDAAVDINLPMERPLFSPPVKVALQSEEILPGEDLSDAVVLFELIQIDRDVLIDHVEHMLRETSQVSLGEILVRFPAAHGLAEILTYMDIAAKRERSVFDETTTEEIQWRHDDGITSKAEIPRVIFTR